MADLLTNMVGVLLFIMIFTVLTAAGGILRTHLPLERATKARPMGFLCAYGRIVRLDHLDSTVNEFIKPMGQPSSSNIDSWLKQFNDHKLETAGFTVSGDAGLAFNGSGLILHAILAFRPKPGFAGSGDAASDNSRFQDALAAASPAERYADFLVYPDGISVFRGSREGATVLGFDSGWTLYGPEEPFRMCIAGCAGGEGVVK
jgi:hypothetical protein